MSAMGRKRTLGYMTVGPAQSSGSQHRTDRLFSKTAEFCGFCNGAPGRIRTYDLKLRRLVLYPTELRARCDVPSCIRRVEKPLVQGVAMRLAHGRSGKRGTGDDQEADAGRSRGRRFVA